MDSIKKALGIVSPEEQVKKWRASLRAQDRVLDRQVRSIDAQEAKVKRELKAAAKKGDRTVCTMLARELVHSRKAKGRIYTSKAQLNSVSMQLGHQLASMKVAGALQKSTEIMQAVNSLVKLPEIQATMQDMAREMMKAGIMEEMMEDAMTGLDDDELEEEAEDEVNKILFEVTDGLLGQGGRVGGEIEGEQPVEEEEEEDPVAMLKRLDALRMPNA
ncbi:Snf7-domain-containing protein [Blastocladiella britannica]|nr:Snf7-domain-containing protein [Blastocladiella britannica]